MRTMVDMSQLEVWAETPERRKSHRGYGMCSTGSEWPIVCTFGGFGCNVDHREVASMNGLAWPPPEPTSWDFWLKDLE